MHINSFIKAIIILPGTALIVIPVLIIWLTKNSSYTAKFPPEFMSAWIIGIAFATAGLILMYWTMKLFNTKGGGGTLAPWEPIKNFIAVGPYCYVRNPMLLGVSLFIIAEALLLVSLPIFIWALTFVGLNTVYFVLSEEPQLEKRFGETYKTYKLNVPRWIPRLTPYNQNLEKKLV